MSGDSILKSAAIIGGVTCVAIIDDAYDAPKPDEITENAFNIFVQLVEGDKGIQEDLERVHNLSNTDLDDWDEFLEKEELIERLWKSSLGSNLKLMVSENSKKALKGLFDDINLDRQSKLTQLAPLEKILEEAEVNILRLDSKPNHAFVAEADIVFLDLYLSSDIPQEVTPGGEPPRSAYDRARDYAIDQLKSVREITSDNLSAIAPAFILISSQGSDQKARYFQKKSGQMTSRFRFVAKQSLNENQPHAILAIADIFRTCKACAIVEPMQKAWPKIAAEATSWIKDKLFEMDISDFGHLYNLQLKEEGQPIYEYVKDLVAEAVAERVSCAFNNLDFPKQEENPFENIPHYFEPPTNSFAELYSITRVSKDLGSRGKLSFELRSGDIFLRKPNARLDKSLVGQRVSVVMSPPCDLIERMGSGPGTKAVLLLEGTLKKSAFDNKQILSINDRYYEIEWELKHPSSLKVRALKTLWKRKLVTWVGRIKGEHFLELQANYLNGLGRIGLMKSPSIYESLHVKVSVVSNGNRFVLGEELDSKSRLAFLFFSPNKSIDNQSLLFSGHFLQLFSDILIKASSDDQLSADVRNKIKGLLERGNQLISMIERKKIKAHSINNCLTVELHENSDGEIKESREGIVSIKLWSK